jgi:DNA relaxase NicK
MDSDILVSLNQCGILSTGCTFIDDLDQCVNFLRIILSTDDFRSSHSRHHELKALNPAQYIKSLKS